MSNPKQLEAAMLDKLESIVLETVQEHRIFSPDEVELLKRVIARERGWAAIGSLASMFKSIVTWIGLMVMGWMALKAGVLDWITSNIGAAK